MAKRISVSTKIVNEILDKGLKNSDWRKKFPEAYEVLEQHHRKWLERSVRDILIKNHKQLVKAMEAI